MTNWDRNREHDADLGWWLVVVAGVLLFSMTLLSVLDAMGSDSSAEPPATTTSTTEYVYLIPPQTATSVPPTTTTAPTTTTTTPPPTTTTEAALVAPTTTQAPPAVIAQAAGAASPYRNWDAVADCESGDGDGQPPYTKSNANTGNGYYGYLQFSAATWRQAVEWLQKEARWDGPAGLPTDHSWETQVWVADDWLNRTDWTQWPECGRYL